VAVVVIFPLMMAPDRLAAQKREASDTTPLTETEKIRHLLSRFSFAPTVEMVGRVREMGMDAWFEEQLNGRVQEDPLLVETLAGLESLEMDATELARTFRTSRRNQARQEVQDAVLYRAVQSPNQVLEVASDFFRNHFNVTVNKSDVRFLVPDYEREVIRGEALGSFGTMLEKSAKHPAMLLYLDNALSRRPLSKAELRAVELRTRLKTGSRERGEESAEIARQRGLNENYARELLELHTLGVDNYYRQVDVVQVARSLTGWTVQRNPDKGVGFLFRADMHCDGDKYLLGTTVKANRKNPVAEGEEILRRLVRHPGTSRFLAWKLCRYFVDDDPPEAMVKRVGTVFRQTRGDLPAVYRAIYEDPEFFNPRYFQSKFKRPFEFVASALRVTGARIESTRGLHRVLAQLSEPIYQCEDPTGYGDQAEAWRDPGVMAVRWRFAMDLTHGRVPGVRLPGSFYEGLHPTISRAWVDQLAARILSTGMSDHTREVLDDMVREYLTQHPEPKPNVLGAMIAGLLLGSPEFQRQ
jgi:uncharacterized protein (DUF1800 family)